MAPHWVSLMTCLYMFLFVGSMFSTVQGGNAIKEVQRSSEFAQADNSRWLQATGVSPNMMSEKRNGSSDQAVYLFNDPFIHHAIDKVPKVTWFVLAVIGAVVGPVVAIKGQSMLGLTVFLCVTITMIVVFMYLVQSFVLSNQDISETESERWLIGSLVLSVILGLVAASAVRLMKTLLLVAVTATSVALVHVHGLAETVLEWVVAGTVIACIALLCYLVFDISIIVLSACVGSFAFMLGVGELVGNSAITPNNLVLYPLDMLTCAGSHWSCYVIIVASALIFLVGVFVQLRDERKKRKSNKKGEKQAPRPHQVTNRTSSSSSEPLDDVESSTPYAQYAEVYQSTFDPSAPPVPTASVVVV